MITKTPIPFFLLFLLLGLQTIQAQNGFPCENGINTQTGEPCYNPLITAVPFLGIVLDSRSAALGDAGIALSGTNNAIHANAARLVFGNKKMGFSASYTPWQRNLGVSKNYLMYSTGFIQLNQSNSLGLSFRYFNLGNSFSSFAEDKKAKEYEIAFAYARKLSPHFSIGITPKYIVSSLLPSFGIEYKSFAVDLSLAYKKPVKIGKKASEFITGMAISNIGPKVGYGALSSNRSHLPTNLGIGSSLQIELNAQHSVSLIGEINKLLVPTPTQFDDDGNGILDFLEIPFGRSMLNSFNDAPGGGAEELRELMYSFGVEYLFRKKYALRCGIFEEHQTKGLRSSITLGIGVNLNDFTIDLSYLRSRKKETINPLDRTIRLTLGYQFNGKNNLVKSSI